MKKNRLLRPRTSFKQKTALVLLGLLLSLIILELGLRLAGIALLLIQEHKNEVALKRKNTYAILCLGESTTAMQYPVFLQEILNKSYRGINFKVFDRGIIGGTTNDIVYNLESNINKYKPDLVVVMMGINDYGKHMPYEKMASAGDNEAFRSWRTFSFFRLLWRRLAEKVSRREQSKTGVEKGMVSEAAETPGDEVVELGLRYRYQGDFVQAEQTFRSAMAVNPNNDKAYCELGRLYRDIYAASQAEEAFKKALALNPKNADACFGLGLFFTYQRFDAEQAEKYFKKAIKLRANSDLFFVELAALFQSMGKLAHAEAVLKEGFAANPESAKLRGALGALARNMSAKAQKSDEGPGEAGVGHYYPITRNNYLELKKILDGKGIKLMCVQYPMREIKPLKMLFGDHAKEIVFVENEKAFKEAVEKEGFGEYFTDMFGGDFGHCTPKGNRLLAQNIANAILEEVFHKQ